MGRRTLRFALAGIAGLLLLSATAFPGAIIGFLTGCAIAFFAAPIGFAGVALLKAAGISAELWMVLAGLGALYAIGVIAAFMLAWRAWTRRDADLARFNVFRGALLSAMPLVAVISMNSLQHAWRI